MRLSLPRTRIKVSTCLLAALLCTSLQAATESNAPNKPVTSKPATPAPFVAKNYTHLQDMEGLPPDLINLHLTLYEGYVKNANLLSTALRALSENGKDRTPEYAGYKRMYGWEYDGMRLHEAYFDQLGGDGQWNTGSGLIQALTAQYGSIEAWKQDFVATGMIRGIGWAVLEYEPTSRRFTNVWVNEHDTGHLVKNEPILIMDVFEHAYMPKYGVDRAAYIDAFFRNLNWSKMYERYSRATKNA